MPPHSKTRGQNSAALVAAVLSIAALIVVSPATASAHEAEGEENWLISHYVPGTLVVSADESLAQWGGSSMLRIEQEEIPVDLMSINNGSFFIIKIQRGFNNSLNLAGVAIRFGAEDFNISTTVWAWEGGQSSNGSSVEANSALNAGVLTVVLGSRVDASGSGIPLEVGTPYDGFVRIATWDNGSSLSSVNLEGIPPIGLELVPYIDHYPKTPLLYSGAVAVAGIGFIFLEARKYRGQKA